MSIIKKSSRVKALPISRITNANVTQKKHSTYKGKALGLLLGEALQLQNQMIQMLREEKKINFQFISSLLALLAILIREILARWSRYLLSPFKAQLCTT